MSPDVIGAVCVACDGYRECEHCEGRGLVKSMSHPAGVTDCPDCYGSGACRVCHGTGETP